MSHYYIAKGGMSSCRACCHPSHMQVEVILADESKPYWMRLPVSMLNERGKEIVSRDPDLSRQTIELLKTVHPPENKYKFYFGEDGDTDVGLAALSMCVGDNVSASMAELVARYADLRHIPFVDTAIAVIHLHETTGIVHYDHSNGFGETIKRIWKPSSRTFNVPPPKKRRENKVLSSVPPVEKCKGYRNNEQDERPPKRLPDMGNLTVEEYRERRRAGIERAKAEGRLGKKPMALPKGFEKLFRQWRANEISAAAAGKQLGVCNKTFLKWARAAESDMMSNQSERRAAL